MMNWSFFPYRSAFGTPGARLSLLAGLLLLSITATAQQQALDSLVRKFNAYRTVATTEKVYVHIDQDVCLTGETMWFKVYLLNASSHEPSKLSKVAYVEVLDNVNHAVLQTKIAVSNGVGSGSLFIPASITSGNYVIRVYTAWMRNFSPTFYFHKQITLINPFRRLELEKKVAAQKSLVQFFPEGGTLVKGIPSRIAYRIVNLYDSMSRLSIQLINGDTTILKPDRYGLGTFSLTPQADKRAVAYLLDDEGHRQVLELPAAADAGYSLTVKDSTNESIALGVRKVNVPDDDNVFLLVHARNVISFARVQRVRGGRAAVVIPRSALAEGISHITVFDASMHPVCERLYFNPVKRILAISATQSQREYGVRRKVTLDLDVHDADGPAAATSLSVAVYRRDSLRRNESHVLNSLWLDSDLQEVPDLPADFLINLTPGKRTILDNIMLTHGWRRFTWSDVAAGKTPPITFIPELRGHIIRGKVNNPEGNPEPGKVTYLSAPGTNIQVYGSVSNKKGEVQYEMKDFSGSRRIAVQTNLSRDSTSKITIVSPFSDQFTTINIKPFSLSPKLAETVATRSFRLQVQDIYYQDRGAQTRSVTIDTTAFYGKADATYYLDDYTRFPVMEEIMREYVPGVLVRKRRDGFHFINLDLVNKGVFNEDPFIMLDGLPLFDADEIMSYDPLKVKKLEVFTRRYYMGVLSLPGIVSYTTYAGDLSGFNIDPHCLVLDYEGLQLQREYYTPRYESAKQRDSRMPDQRDRLFWAPSVVTDNDGKQHLEFFTSDITGEYEVLVEGVSTKGAAGGTKSKFAVVSLND
ncbi:MAG TPA: hypothetical protein VK658_20850 [Chryseolinea sp.]|nr:hypothetical protein [Chryseolinea sp.]